MAIHAYRDQPAGTVELEFEIRKDAITIRLLDTGRGFVPSAEAAPDLAALPESHMGLYIMRSFMDEVSYRRGDPPGTPNVLTLVKRYAVAGS